MLVVEPRVEVYTFVRGADEAIAQIAPRLLGAAREGEAEAAGVLVVQALHMLGGRRGVCHAVLGIEQPAVGGVFAVEHPAARRPELGAVRAGQPGALLPLEVVENEPVVLPAVELRQQHGDSGGQQLGAVPETERVRAREHLRRALAEEDVAVREVREHVFGEAERQQLLRDTGGLPAALGLRLPVHVIAAEEGQPQGHGRRRGERQQRAQPPVREPHRRGLHGVARLVELLRELHQRDENDDERREHEQPHDAACRSEQPQRVEQDVPDHEPARRRGTQLQPRGRLRVHDAHIELQRHAEHEHGGEHGEHEVRGLRAYHRAAEEERGELQRAAEHRGVIGEAEVPVRPQRAEAEQHQRGAYAGQDVVQK